MPFKIKAFKIKYKIQLLLNKIFNIAINNNDNSHYNVHFTSVIKYGQRLKIKNGRNNRSVIKSLNNSIGCYFNCRNGLEFGERVMFGPNVSFISSNHKINARSESINNIKDKILINDNVWIGSHVVILPGVTIGENTIIGAGSVVTKSIPSNKIALGNPATIIRELD